MPREDIGDRLVYSLRSWGLSAKVKSIHAGDNPIGAALQEPPSKSMAASSSWVDGVIPDFETLCLMGYGRLLADLRLPVLMSH
ncbi:MAG: hypothetical protein EOR61_00710 [Mesorhizobium sp.]|jgi:hypothetical protein|nr:MAG: hypothetical protein EOR61_00710 [Mesorhizobium sp.]